VVCVLTIGLFIASIPAYYDWLVDLADSGLDPATVRANLQAAGKSVDLYATYLLSIHTASAMLWSGVAVIIFWRRSDDGMALFTSLGLLMFGVFFLTDGPYVLAAQYPAMSPLVRLLAFFGSVFFYLFFYLFPNGRFVPRWMFWIPLLWVAHEAAYYFFPDSVFNIRKSNPLLDSVASLTFLCLGIGSQLYRYRHVSSQVERQQTKWVVFGMGLAGLGTVGFGLLIKSSPTLVQFGSPYAFVLQASILGSMLLIPLSIGVAILRYHLWDIDIIINRTLVYSTLSVVLTSMFAITDTLMQSLFFFTTGVEQSWIATFASVIVIGVGFQPLRNRIQGGVNKLGDWLSNWLAGGDAKSESPR